MSVIKIDGTTALLEITARCYTGCKYCFKKGSVHSKANHTDTDLILQRINWISQFTDADTISLLGGEPLLHPDFIKICEYIISKDLRVDIVTSGVVSSVPVEVRNLNYAVFLYKTDKLFIELSSHSGRNEKAYEILFKRLKKVHKARRLAQKSQGRYFPTRYDLSTTAVVPAGIKDLNGLWDNVKNVLKVINIDDFPKDSERFGLLYEAYEKHFSSQDGYLNFSIMPVDERTDFRVNLRFMGESVIDYKSGGPVIYRPQSGVCPAIKSEVGGTDFDMSSLLIRADGGVSFAESQCVDMHGPMLNVDLHDTEAKIYDALSGSLKQIKVHVFAYNRMKAKDNCGPDGVEHACTACPFDKMCTPCWTTTRPWQK